MITKILHKMMNSLGRYRLIPDRRTGANYLHRYYLFLKNRSWFPFNLTLHKIVQSDDPIFHDHPWSFVTVILKGGYYEWTPMFNSKGEKFGEISKWRGPGSVIFRKATDYHWLELEMNKPAVTLFFMGRQRRNWGFLVPLRNKKHRWIRNDHYINDWKEYHNEYVVPNSKINKSNGV